MNTMSKEHKLNKSSILVKILFKVDYFFGFLIYQIKQFI